MKNAKTMLGILILAVIFGGPLASANASPEAPTYTITVTGTWKFYDKNFVAFNLRDARIEFWDEDGATDEFLGVIYTDINGYYQRIVTSSEVDGPDIYVKVFARDDSSVWVGSSANDISTTYTKSSIVYGNQTGGTLNIGTIYIDDPNDRMAFYIYDLIADNAYYYLSTNVSWVNSYNLPVQWYPNSDDGTYYDFVNDQIHIKGLDRWDSDVILHEFGHFVMDKIYGAYPPTPNCNPHFWNAPSSEGCAWTEGWATFLQAAIQNNRYYDDTENYDPPLHFDLEIPPVVGADVEGAVAGSLWDVFDNEVESWDKITRGINGTSSNGIWKIVYNNDPNIAKEFEIYWMRSNNGFNCEAIEIFAHHAIGTRNCVYVPDLRNQNGWITEFYAYNEGASAISVTIKYYGPNGSPTQVDNGYDECSLASKQSCWLPVNGHNRIQTAGSAVITSIDASVSAVAENLYSSGGTLKSVTNYTGIQPAGQGLNPDWGQAGTTVYAPTVKYNFGSPSRTTSLYIMNTGTANTTVTVTYYDDNGNTVASTTCPTTLVPNAQCIKTPTQGSLMSAKITTNPSQPLAAVAVEYDSAQYQVASYNLLAIGATELYAPVVKKEVNSQNTGLRLQNTSTTATASYYVYYYYEGTGGLYGLYGPFSISPKGAALLNAYTVLPNGFLGSARVTSSQPIVVGHVSEAGPTRKMGSSFFKLTTSTLVYVPRVCNPCTVGGVANFISGIRVQNVGTANAAVTIQYYGDTGQLVGGDISISSLGSYQSQNALSSLIPASAKSAIITADRPIVVVVNLANADTTRDLTMTYNAPNR